MGTMETGYRNRLLQSFVDGHEASGTAFGFMRAEAAGSGTAIATLLFSTAAFASADAGTAVANAITAGVCNTGTVDHVCFYERGTVKSFTATVGTATADFIIGNPVVASGESLTCTALVLTLPA